MKVLKNNNIINTGNSTPSLEMHITITFELPCVAPAVSFHCFSSQKRRPECVFLVFFTWSWHWVWPINIFFGTDFFHFSLIFLDSNFLRYIAMSPFPCQRVFHYLIKSVGRSLDCFSFLILKCYHVHFYAGFPVNLYKRFFVVISSDCSLWACYEIGVLGHDQVFQKTDRL